MLKINKIPMINSIQETKIINPVQLELWTGLGDLIYDGHHRCRAQVFLNYDGFPVVFGGDLNLLEKAIDYKLIQSIY